MILCLETATSLCSVALCDRNSVVASRESREDKSHASRLTVFIEEILKETGIKAGMLEAVAVSKGPGSYTGLRIGVSTGKGIAYAVSVPLISVGTTLSMFLGFTSGLRYSNNIREDDLFCPALDARRMEIYYSVFDREGNIIRPVTAEVIDKNFLSDIGENRRVHIFGDGAAKCRSIAGRNNFIISENFQLSAGDMRLAAYKAFDQSQFEDVTYFEPFYLKDFLATKPVKNILGK